MNEQEQVDPLSFKGQMAARYRERLSMGFTLASGNKNITEDYSMVPSHTAGTSSDGRVTPFRQGAFRAAGEGMMNESRVRTPRNPNIVTLPVAGRSKSIGEHEASTSKPTMKELITKFETRSFTSSQLKLNEDVEKERQRIARDAWGSSSPRIKLELDPNAMTSSSSSDVADSKSSPSLSKPPHAKISRAALSLNSETNNPTQQLIQPTTNIKFTSDNTGAEDNRTETPRLCLGGFQNVKDLSQKQTEGVINTDMALELKETTISPGSASVIIAGNAGLNDADKNAPSGQSDSTVPPPLRVSLRGIAARKKTSSANKYIVHKKDWGKKLPSRAKDSESPIVISNREALSQAIEKKLLKSKEVVAQSVNGIKPSDTLNIHRETSSKTVHQSSSPQSSNTAQKPDTRSSSRQSERQHDVVNDEKKRTNAMERYLQFLKSNNPPVQNLRIAGVKSFDKTELRKALRPPTPQRTCALRKRAGSPRHGMHALKNNNLQESLRMRQTLNRELRTGANFRHSPASKPPLSTDRKDTVTDHSGGDCFVRVALSSTNSVDSSVYEYPSKLSPQSCTGQPKSETFGTKHFGPLPRSRPASIWTYLPGKNTKANTLLKSSQTQSAAAGTNDITITKPGKQLATFLHARSASAGKAPDARNIMKSSPLTGHSPKSINSASSKSINQPFQRSPSHKYSIKERNVKSSMCHSSDIGSLILTEDEIADNDLVPVHLRERNVQEASANISLMHSSSDDSYSAIAKTPLINNPTESQLGKTPDLSPDKQHSNTPDLPSAKEPQYFDREDSKPISKYFLSIEEPKLHRSNASTPHEEKLSSESKLYVLHSRRRKTPTPTKYLNTGHIFDDSSNHQITNNQQQQRAPNIQYNAVPKVTKTADVGHKHTIKDSRDTKIGSNLHSNVVPDERRGTSREGRERKNKEDLYNASEALGCRGDSFQAPVESSTEKGKSSEPVKESPTRKSTRHLAGHSSSMAKEHAKEKKVDGCADTALLNDNNLRCREPLSRVSENACSFHFGHSDGKEEGQPDLEKVVKALSESPQKRRKKSDQSKKGTKKKKKIEEVDEETSTLARSQVTTKGSAERKSLKEKVKETKEKEENNEKNNEKIERAEIEKLDPIVEQEGSVGDASVKSHPQPGKYRRTNSAVWVSKKTLSRENSATSVLSDFKSSPKNVLASSSPEKSTATVVWKSPSPECLIPSARPVQRLSCEPTGKFAFRSRIPLLVLRSVTPRRKLDRLIQYRRWKEAMLDCLRPSRLPMSVSFRKTLDSAVMEEWALHCWQPSRDMYVDDQGIWWSASYQEVESSDISDTLISGRLFSAEGFLDLSARLPYMKVGPVKFLHATYALWAAACVTLGHFGAKLYHCGGDDFEYYCPDDDVDCLMQML